MAALRRTATLKQVSDLFERDLARAERLKMTNTAQ